jgi:hypothetical protein
MLWNVMHHLFDEMRSLLDEIGYCACHVLRCAASVEP